MLSGVERIQTIRREKREKSITYHLMRQYFGELLIALLRGCSNINKQGRLLSQKGCKVHLGLFHKEKGKQEAFPLSLFLLLLLIAPMLHFSHY